MLYPIAAYTILHFCLRSYILYTNYNVISHPSTINWKFRFAFALPYWLLLYTFFFSTCFFRSFTYSFAFSICSNMNYITYIWREFVRYISQENSYYWIMKREKVRKAYSVCYPMENTTNLTFFKAKVKVKL